MNRKIDKKRRTLALKATNSLDDEDEDLDGVDTKKMKMKWPNWVKSFKEFSETKEIKRKGRHSLKRKTWIKIIKVEP